MSAAAPISVRAVTLMTSDGVRLRADWLRSATDPGPAVVLCHGFTQCATRPAIRQMVTALSAEVPVLVPDLRGHGRSDGACTLGDDEVHDIAAAVAEARRQGHTRVATLGVSMGAAIVLRHTALAEAEQRPDAVAAVSGPSRWWIRETAAMRRVHWVVEQPHGRIAGRLVGVRIAGHWYDGGWAVVPASPVEVMDRIAPTPLLLVHGSHDEYFGTDHAVALHRAADGHGELWLEPGMGHGAGGTSPALVHRIVAWARAVTAPGSAGIGPEGIGPEGIGHCGEDGSVGDEQDEEAA